MRISGGLTSFPRSLGTREQSHKRFPTTSLNFTAPCEHWQLFGNGSIDSNIPSCLPYTRRLVSKLHYTSAANCAAYRLSAAGRSTSPGQSASFPAASVTAQPANRAPALATRNIWRTSSTRRNCHRLFKCTRRFSCTMRDIRRIFKPLAAKGMPWKFTVLILRDNNLMINAFEIRRSIFN